MAGLPPASILLVPIYTPGWRDALWELSVLPNNTTQFPWPGLEPGPLDPKSSTLTMRYHPIISKQQHWKDKSRYYYRVSFTRFAASFNPRVFWYENELTWPYKMTFFIGTEPIHVKNLRHFAVVLFHAQPVLHVLAKIVTKEGPHGKRISHDCFRLVFCSSCGLWRHRWGNEHSMLPVKGLIDQRNSLRASATKQYCTDRYAFRILPVLVHDWTMVTRGTESWVRMCCLGVARLPVFLPKPTSDAHIFWQV